MADDDDLHFDSVFDDDDHASSPEAHQPQPRETSGRRRQVSFAEELGDSNGHQPNATLEANGGGGRQIRAGSNGAVTVARSRSRAESSPVDGKEADDFAHSLESSAVQRRSQHRLSPNNFKLICMLGKGAYGKVVQARHKATKQIFALKILEKKEIETSKSDVVATKRERDILTLMNHPFIVKLHGAFQTKTKLYLLMDYVCGGELFHHINKQGIFMEEQARVYIGEMVLALEHLHSHGIIHRDLKPENILLGADGHVILTDFGLSKIGIKDGITHKTLCGTNEYMAPEMINGGGYGRSVDWWALGTLVYEMLTGDPPFHCKNVNKLFHLIKTKKVSLPNYLTKDCHALIRGLLDRNVDRRLGCARHTPFKVGGVRQLKDHPFFASLDWVALANKEVPAPFKLELESELDVQYFDEQFTSENIADVSDHDGYHGNSNSTSAATTPPARGGGGGSPRRAVGAASPALHPVTPPRGTAAGGGGDGGGGSNQGSPGEPVTPGPFGGFSWVSPELEARVEHHRQQQRGRSGTGGSCGGLEGVDEAGEGDDEEKPAPLTEKQRLKLESSARRRAAWEAREAAKLAAAGEGAEEKEAVAAPKNVAADVAGEGRAATGPPTAAAGAGTGAGVAPQAAAATTTTTTTTTTTQTAARPAAARGWWQQQKTASGSPAAAPVAAVVAASSPAPAPAVPASARKYRPPHPKHGAAAPAPAPVRVGAGGAWGRNLFSHPAAAAAAAADVPAHNDGGGRPAGTPQAARGAGWAPPRHRPATAAAAAAAGGQRRASPSRGQQHGLRLDAVAAPTSNARTQATPAPHLPSPRPAAAAGEAWGGGGGAGGAWPPAGVGRAPPRGYARHPATVAAGGAGPSGEATAPAAAWARVAAGSTASGAAPPQRANKPVAMRATAKAWTPPWLTPQPPAAAASPQRGGGAVAAASPNRPARPRRPPREAAVATGPVATGPVATRAGAASSPMQPLSLGTARAAPAPRGLWASVAARAK